MFLKFARSRRNTSAPQSSLFNIFINSRFFVPVLLIASFLLLTVIPNLIRSFAFVTGITISKQISLYILVSTKGRLTNRYVLFKRQLDVYILAPSPPPVNVHSDFR